MLRPATKPVTLHHLLTHTSGFAYDTWDGSMLKYNAQHGGPSAGAVAPLTPLIFEPGTRWQYGTSMDWAGKLVEAVSGLTLEQYFQKNILQPLGMKDTTFVFPTEKFDRSGYPPAAGSRTDLEGRSADHARAAQSLQWRRRTVLHRARLHAFHADDSASGPRPERARRSCSRRRWR